MVNLKYVRAALSKEESDKIVQAVIDGHKSMDDAAKELGMAPDQFKSNYDAAMRSYGTTGYGNDVQKVISYKGTIRQMTLSATNKKGGKYPLKVVNIYIKPNSERYYEEQVYSVDKDKIRKGTPSNGYHPDKALWAKTKDTTKTPKTPTQAETPPVDTTSKSKEWKAAPGFDIGRKKRSSNMKVKLHKHTKKTRSRNSK